MVTATWNGAVLAQSDETIVMDDVQYFPAHTVDKAYLRPSDKKTKDAAKGEAGHYTVEVGTKKIKDGAWFFANPKDAAKQIAGYIAFGKGIDIIVSQE